MSFTRSDFSETLDLLPIDKAGIKRVLAAWGDSTEGYGEWAGGFLIEFHSRSAAGGRYAYITGWCDTTGWGCQDGADVTYYKEEPALSSLEETTEGYMGKRAIRWEHEPADLNRFVRGEIGVCELDEADEARQEEEPT